MNYANGKIYTIRSYLTDNIYIGSTTQSLTKRLSVHKANYKGFIAGNYRNTTSFEIIKFGDAYIELIEECPCENRNQLCKREGELIRLTACVNKNIAGRTKAEYCDDNKEQIKEQLKEYREQNKDKIKEKKKEYYQDNKDKIKLYYQDNKDKINEKFVCECGGNYIHVNKAQHFKSKRHLKFVQIGVPQQDKGKKIGTENI